MFFLPNIDSARNGTQQHDVRQSLQLVAMIKRSNAMLAGVNEYGWNESPISVSPIPSAAHRLCTAGLSVYRSRHAPKNTKATPKDGQQLQ